jgi:hypothetical protein
MRTTAWASGVALVFCVGCGFRFGSSVDSSTPPSLGDFGAPPAISSTPDIRPVVTATKPPPPISGGTLLVTHDGKLAVAADPDRDRVSIVSIPDQIVLQTVALEQGDEPGRVVEDGAGRVHVALRRAGAIASIDLATGALLSRRAVCGVPRGIAYDAATDRIHVACGDGALVTLPASGGDVVRRVTLDIDLRDVGVTPDGLWVSRFKSAELLRLDADGNVTTRTAGYGIQRNSMIPLSGSNGIEPIEPAVAWRTIGMPDGSIQMLHQYALAAPIPLGEPKTTPAEPVSSSPYGMTQGKQGICGGLVQPAVSRFDADGTVHMGAPITDSVLAVDAASSPDGRWIAIAEAGHRDPKAPSAFAPPSGANGSVTILAVENLPAVSESQADCAPSMARIDLSGQSTAVAFNPGTDDLAKATNTWFIVQSRSPAMLTFIKDPGGTVTANVLLGGDDVTDTGHEIFHRDSGGGIACASCHSEGQEDGRVWQFSPLGNRRTQAIDVGLEGTAPFHWDGDMKDFDALVQEVFVHRMGGPEESPARENSLSRWVFSLRPRTSVVSADDPGALRGKALFESSDVGCAACHAGAHFTTNVNAEVGTTEAGHTLQVPSLRGVGYRAPFLHDGRAPTLLERFDPTRGGGDLHGHTSQLNQAHVGDLIAYLDSI